MTVKYLSRATVIVAISLTLSLVPCTAADAQSRSRSSRPRPEASLPTKGQVDGAVAGIIAGAVVGTIVVIYLLTRKQTITGCVSSSADGLTITDEKDTRVYTIAGSLVGVTPGNRMVLQGKKGKSTDAGTPPVWETEKV